MSYEKQLEEKIENIEASLDDNQEVTDELARSLIETRSDCKLSYDLLEKAINVIGDMIDEERKNVVYDTYCKAFYDLQSSSSILFHIIEEIENKLDDFGYLNE